MKPIGQFPTPYGVSIPVFFDRGRSAKEEDCFFHDIDGCMTMAGIYDVADRDRCKAEFKGNKPGYVTFDLLLKNGGRKVPRVSIAKPRDPVYPQMPHGMVTEVPIENWVTLVLDHAAWHTRAVSLLEAIGSNLDDSEKWAFPQELHALALSQMMTASIEHLVETEIDCIEAAAMYALCLHYAEWATPAVSWLEPFSQTWFRQWVAERPVYRRFANLVRIINPDLPEWIAGGAS
ncbi:MAG: hypothetical protein R3D70_14240 [Rhizobiaceae bacterium]